jgi:Type II/IV secretion system protein/GAF domain
VQSIAGYTAMQQEMVSISDVYDEDSLKRIHPQLTFLKEVDKRSGYRTKQMLVVPILDGAHLYGVLQVINNKSDTPFGELEIEGATQLCKTLATAIRQREQRAQDSQRRKATKYDGLVVMCLDPEATRGARVVPQVFPRLHKFSYRVTTHTEFEETLAQLFGSGSDGKIKFKKYGPLDIEQRVSTIPSAGGVEDVVMRILSGSVPIPLEKLRLTSYNREQVEKTVSKPYGLFYVCGPTGSGKTTTLHSILKLLNTPDTKIWTAEDPVEITQKDLRQVQINKKAGIDFTLIMRAFLTKKP